MTYKGRLRMCKKTNGTTLSAKISYQTEQLFSLTENTHSDGNVHVGKKEKSAPKIDGSIFMLTWPILKFPSLIG